MSPGGCGGSGQGRGVNRDRRGLEARGRAGGGPVWKAFFFWLGVGLLTRYIYVISGCGLSFFYNKGEGAASGGRRFRKCESFF